MELMGMVFPQDAIRPHGRAPVSRVGVGHQHEGLGGVATGSRHIEVIPQRPELAVLLDRVFLIRIEADGGGIVLEIELTCRLVGREALGAEVGGHDQLVPDGTEFTGSHGLATHYRAASGEQQTPVLEQGGAVPGARHLQGLTQTPNPADRIINL